MKSILSHAFGVVVFVLPALAACSASPGNDTLSGAPTCDPREVWISGSVESHTEDRRGSMGAYSLSESVLGSSVDFDVQGKGHVHLEWTGKAGEGNEVLVSTGTYVSAAGATYCVGNFSKVVLTASGGQFELTDLKAGACPGTRDVDGTIEGCFDGG